MNKEKFLSIMMMLMLVALPAITLSSCGGGDDDGPAATPTPSPSPTPSPVPSASAPEILDMKLSRENTVLTVRATTHGIEGKAGVCYSNTEKNPTISSNTSTTSIMKADGSYQIHITYDKPIPNTTCYCRAYIIKTDKTVVYSETKSITIPVLEAVDMGLSVKWAAYNIGASKPEELGYYFAWGETTPQDDNELPYSWYDYKWAVRGLGMNVNKYNTDPESGMIVDNKTTLESLDDAATANWGGNWRMPTKAEAEELLDETKCILNKTNRNGMSGYEVTSIKTGKSIFFPITGYFEDGRFIYVGFTGDYWLSSVYTEFPLNAHQLRIDTANKTMKVGYWHRCCGCPVRAVCK